MFKQLTAVSVIILAAACASQQAGQAPAAGDREAGLPAARIGLDPHAFGESPPPAAIAFNTADPGESKLRPRAFPGAPPVIPHSTEGLVPIEREANACLDCHDRTNAADSGAPSAPPSHYRDLRNAPEKSRDSIAGARFICTTCHAAATETQPLVDNTFRP